MYEWRDKETVDGRLLVSFKSYANLPSNVIYGYVKQ